MTEEEIDVEFLSIDIEDIAQSIEFSTLDVEQYYKENLDRFRSNEERKSSHILISFDDEVIEDAALEQSKDILLRIKDGESFEELAEEFSDDGGSAENGGDLGLTPIHISEPTRPRLISYADFCLKKKT